MDPGICQGDPHTILHSFPESRTKSKIKNWSVEGGGVPGVPPDQPMNSFVQFDELDELGRIIHA